MEEPILNSHNKQENPASHTGDFDTPNFMEKYEGIRYAHADRFELPVMEPALGCLEDADITVRICPQHPSRLDSIIGPSGNTQEQSEDCLRLSVFTPSTTGNMPVLVWIHGGAYLTGSGLYPQYDASQLAQEGNMVVVCISYRLGCFGFLHNPGNIPDNLGIADQVCALKWVKRNISLFGGNPDDVTIFGQSAGGYSVLHHIANVQEPLFRKAIVASAPFAKTSARKMKQNTRLWYKLLGDDPKQCSVERMLQAQREVAKRGIGGMPFSAICSDICSPQHIAPGLEAVMLWCQQDDAGPFVPVRWLTRPVTRLLFQRPMKRYVRFLHSKGIDAACSVKTWRHGDSPFGATHCMELPLLFGDYQTWKDAPFMAGVRLEEYKCMARKAREELIAFIAKKSE